MNLGVIQSIIVTLHCRYTDLYSREEIEMLLQLPGNDGELLQCDLNITSTPARREDRRERNNKMISRDKGLCLPHVQELGRQVQGVPKKTPLCVQSLLEALKSVLQMKVG